MTDSIKQYRITSENILKSEEFDCVLPENDPARELIASSYLGGLGLRAHQLQKVQTEYRKKLEQISENSRYRPILPK